MRKPFEIQLGVCTVRIYPKHYMLTTFPDGATRFVSPGDDAATACRSYDLGYAGDIWVMTLDHEIALTWLAQQAGLEYSRSLHHHAGLEELSEDDEASEQGRAWSYQRDLDKHTIRPWFRSQAQVRGS